MYTHQEAPQSTVLFPLWFKTDIKFNLEPGPKTGHLVSFLTICIHFNMADQVEPTRYCGAHICERSTSVGDRPWWWVHTTSSSHTLLHTACCPSLGRAHSSVLGGSPPPGLEGEDNRALLRRLGTTLRRAVEWSNVPQTGGAG